MHALKKPLENVQSEQKLNSYLLLNILFSVKKKVVVLYARIAIFLSLLLDFENKKGYRFVKHKIDTPGGGPGGGPSGNKFLRDYCNNNLPQRGRWEFKKLAEI